MACVRLTTKLKEIAKQLGIEEGRVLTLASTSKKSDNWTLEDIKAELEKQNEKKLQEFELMDGVIYEDAVANIPLIRSDKNDKSIHIGIPTENPVSTILVYLKTVIPNVSQETLQEIPSLLTMRGSSKIFLNYFATEWLVAAANNQSLDKALQKTISKFKNYLNYVKDALPKWTPFSKKLTQEQQDQFSRLFGPYDEGGGADINKLFVQPLPREIDIAITNVIRGNGEMLTRDMMVWIINNLKEDYRGHLSSFYPKAKGENISSKGSEFAKQLTNVGNNITVTYKGTTFRNAEHAYQTWKSGTFDEDAFNSPDTWKPVGSKPADRNTNFQTMVEILTAKLQQHPELVEGINQRGGLDYINSSTHTVTGDKYWETSGQNAFIKALAQAYTNATQVGQEEVKDTSIGSHIQKHRGNWSRQEAQNNPRTLYVFTDNTDRDSGSGIIPADSWYSQKYGEGHHFPTMTAAVVRGLDNARPISTQRWYHQGAKGTTGRWIDADVEEFRQVIETELQDIIEAWNSGNYDTIMFPDGDGLFNTNISNITMQRTPALYKALSDLLNKYGMNRLVPQVQQEQAQSIGGFTRQQVQEQPVQQQTIGGFSRTQAQQAVENLPQEDKKPTISMPQAHTEIANVRSEDNPRIQFHRTFTALEKAEAVEALVTDFSSVVDSMIREDRLKAQQSGNTMLADSLTNLDDTGRRKFIAGNITRILEQIKQNYANYLNNEVYRQSDLNRFGQDFVDAKINWLTKMTDNSNFEILMQDAAIGIERVENIAIGYDFKTVDESKNAESTQTDNETDPEEEVKDGWMIKVREVDPRLTLSSRVKKTIATLPRGREMNILGKPKMLSPDYVHAVLVNELASIAYVEDFIKKDGDKFTFPALENLATKYPWINVLIRKLQQSPELASQFFTDFRKDFIAYTEVIDVYETDEKTGKIVRDGKGNPIIKTVTKDLNKAVALDATLSEILTNYEQGNALTEKPIYTAGKVNESNRQEAKSRLDTLYRSVRNNTLSYNEDSDREQIFKELLDLLHAVGFNTQLNDLQALYQDADFNTEIQTIFDKLSVILGNKISEDVHLVDHFQDAYTTIAEVVARVSEVMNIQSFRAGDKMFYSYSVPNYINTMVKRLKDTNDSRRAEYIEREFGKYEWFYDHKNNRWRNGWIEQLANNASIREHFTIEDMNVIEIIDENGEKTTVPYREWTQEQIAKAFILQYYAYPTQSKSNVQYAKYNTPIYSDSPVVNFITMPRYTGEGFRDTILEKLVDVVEQELVRIKDIADRNAVGTKIEIANYDRQGNKFLFFPALNNIPNFYETINDLYKQGKVDEARATIMEALSDIMERGAEEYRHTYPVTKQDLINQGLNVANDEDFKEALDEYYWNQAYATTQIIQLTTTDLAYYKNGVDFQKRYKEVYAAGNKLNTQSKYGKEKERVLYLSDEEIPSVSLPQITEVLEQAVQEGRITKLDKEAILSKFEKVNVADAQAYRGITSMRAVLDMIGQWTPEMEKAVEKFKDGNWTTADFSMVWQTIKPFMFTQIEDTSGGGSRKVSHQNKNSEFLLLAMHSLIAGSNIGKSPVLKALNTFMEENKIDVVMFESAVKAGGQSTVDIKDGMTYAEVMSKLNEAKSVPTAIKEFDYEDYVIQQPTPEHLIDHIGIFGSQFRNLIVSDISDDAEFTLPGKGKVNKQELLKLYQGAIVENLLEDYTKVKGKFATIEKLQEALLDSIKGNPKYGTDIVEALQIVDGRFNIPLWNPSISEKLQEVVNSFFKTIITKQQIRGGNAILVSDFGFVEELKCLYDTDANGKKHLKGVECYLPAYSKQFYKPFMKKDVQGNEYLDIKEMPDDLKEAIGYRIPTEDKYSMVPLIIKGFLPQANGSAIMLPADITVHAGSDFDVDKMFLMLPEFNVITDWQALERDVLKQEGFKKWGKDNVRIAIDMIKNGAMAFSEDTPEMAIYDYYAANRKSYITVVKVKYNYGTEVKDNNRAQRNNLLIDIARSVLTNADTVDKFINPGSFDKLKRTARITEIADNPQLWEKLRDEMSDQGSIPTNEDMIKAILNHQISDKVLQTIAAGEERDPLNPLTFMYYHKQNMTGGALIGMYANNTTLFSKFQSYDQSKTRMRLKFEFMLNGVKFSRLDGIISPHGERISKNCAEFSAASVDNVKDPVLAKLMQSTDTANITALMLRTGMSVEEIGLLFTQPVIKRWIEEAVGNPKYKDAFAFIVETLSQNKSLGNYVQTLLSDNFESDVLNANFSSEDLLNAKIDLSNGKFEDLTVAGRADLVEELSKEDENLLRDQLRILFLMDKLYQASKQLAKITKVARADSPNGAMAITIAGNLIQKARVESLRAAMLQDDWMIEGADIYNEEMTADKSKDSLRETIMNSRFPMLQAFYSLGIDFADTVMRDADGTPYFIQHDPKVMYAMKYMNAIAKYDTLTEEQANKFFRDYIKYELSGLPMFGEENFNTQRDFYLTQYPSRFIALKAAHPEIADIPVIRKIGIGKSGLEFTNSARLTPAMKDSFMRDLEDLLNGNDLERQLAIDLFTYSYYKDGLYFGPNSFGNFFSTRFITQVPEFIDGLRNIDTSSVNSFTKQFIVNNFKLLPKLPYYKAELGKNQAFVGYKQGTNKTEVILRNKYINNTILNGVQPYFYQEVEDPETKVVYYFIWELTNKGSESSTFRKLPAASLEIGGARYNKNMSAVELANYRVDSGTLQMYAQVSQETPVDYIKEVEVKDFTKAEQKNVSEEKYSSNTNENKTEFC